MVDVQQASLGPFEKDVVPRLDAPVEDGRGAAQVFLQLAGIDAVLLDDGLLGKGGFAEELFQEEVLLGKNLLELAGEGLGLDQVDKTNAAPADLVFVGRADATPGGADLAVAGTLLPGDVDRLVVGHDDVDVAVDHQLAVLLEVAFLLQVGDLLEKDLRVENHAVANDAALALMEDARRNQVQDGFFVADHQGVAGIVAALEAYHIIGVLGVDVNNLAFALIAPLGAHNYHVGHMQILLIGFTVQNRRRESPNREAVV